MSHSPREHGSPRAAAFTPPSTQALSASILASPIVPSTRSARDTMRSTSSGASPSAPTASASPAQHAADSLHPTSEHEDTAGHRPGQWLGFGAAAPSARQGDASRV